eukprot:TRINITY_DN726_c0_g2_i1.p1 TRINITY_DN726_c0_g2~~TRINITY_DN726_c0_g2_i1.p1  ORF type:complete len:279 (-),score=46.91 TRINITY_DN726_c0_g2_i1:171-1007(-)
MSDLDYHINAETQKKLQSIFQFTDSSSFLLRLCIQLGNTPSCTPDELAVKYELSVENAIKLSLAARLLHGSIPETWLEKSVPEEQSQTTLYVRNLPSTTTEHEIIGVFQSFGSIREVRMQRDKETGQFYGAAFIAFVNPAAAKLANLTMNQKMWGNNTIHTDFAKERPRTKPPTTQEESVPPSQTLFVANLPNEADRTMLYSIFSRFGSILDVRILTDKLTGATKGVAFVDFSIKESAMAAKEELDGTALLGRTMKVMYSSNPSKKTTPYPTVPPMGI